MHKRLPEKTGQAEVGWPPVLRSMGHILLAAPFMAVASRAADIRRVCRREPEERERR